MQFVGLMIFVLIIYLAYQVGRIKGKAEMLLNKGAGAKRPSAEKIEEAEYEEIK
jgi:hypothetical protein